MKKAYYYLLIITMAYGCSSDNEAPPPAPVLTTIEINSSSGNQLDLSGTNTTTLTVSGSDQFNNSIAVNNTQWSSDNSNVSISQAGIVTGQAVGRSIITASSGNISSNITINVIDSENSLNVAIYVSDAGNFDSPPWQILKFDENGNNPEVFINQNLDWPQDIVFLEDQNIVLISNLNSGKISRYNSSSGGYIDDFATGIGGPTRMKIGPDDLLYVLQWSGNGSVLRYQLDGTFVDEFTSVGVPCSIGIDWDSSGNLYVSSYHDDLIRKFNPNGEDEGLFVSSNLVGPTNLYFDDGGNLIVIDFDGGDVKQYDASGNFLGDYINGLNQPEGFDFLPNGNLLIGDGGTGSVKMFNSNGDFISNIIPNGSGGLLQPNAVVVRDLN